MNFEVPKPPEIRSEIHIKKHALAYYTEANRYSIFLVEIDGTD